jgi:hypothetical protein
MPERGLWNAAYLGLARYDPGVLNPRVAKLTFEADNQKVSRTDRQPCKSKPE